MDTFKSARMLTLVIVLQFGEDLIDSCTPLIEGKVERCVPCNDLFGSLFHTVDVSRWAAAVLPLDAAHITEFGAADATWAVS